MHYLPTSVFSLNPSASYPPSVCSSVSLGAVSQPLYSLVTSLSACLPTRVPTCPSVRPSMHVKVVCARLCVQVLRVCVSQVRPLSRLCRVWLQTLLVCLHTHPCPWVGVSGRLLPGPRYSSGLLPDRCFVLSWVGHCCRAHQFLACVWVLLRHFLKHTRVLE